MNNLTIHRAVEVKLEDYSGSLNDGSIYNYKKFLIKDSDGGRFEIIIFSDTKLAIIGGT